MKYALVVNKQSETGRVNIGDYIQCLAAAQYLPHIDFIVDRENLNRMDYESAKIIMNGWFTYHPENWPPNAKLIPLFLSFHLNPTYANKLLSKVQNVEYLKKHSPIGCRDYTTLNLLQKYHIPSYFSFCLTSTLDVNFKREDKTNSIIFCDVIYQLQKKTDIGIKITDKNILKKIRRITAEIIKGTYRKKTIHKLIPKYIYEQGIHLSQEYPAGKTTEEYFEIARELLEQYATAKLVITSRIHCAIPCLALGTPVLFIPDGINKGKAEISRLRGIVEYLNILTTYSPRKIKKIFGDVSHIYTPGSIDWKNPPENPNTHIILSKELKQKCNNFVTR